MQVRSIEMHGAYGPARIRPLSRELAAECSGSARYATTPTDRATGSARLPHAGGVGAARWDVARLAAPRVRLARETRRDSLGVWGDHPCAGSPRVCEPDRARHGRRRSRPRIARSGRCECSQRRDPHPSDRPLLAPRLRAHLRGEWEGRADGARLALQRLGQVSGLETGRSGTRVRRRFAPGPARRTAQSAAAASSSREAAST